MIRTCGLPTWETVYLRIDNQLNPNHPAVDHDCGGITSHLCVDEPEAYIRSLVKNEGCGTSSRCRCATSSISSRPTR